MTSQVPVRAVEWGEFRRSLTPNKKLLYISRPDRYELYVINDDSSVMSCVVRKSDGPGGRRDRDSLDCSAFRQHFKGKAKRIFVPPMGMSGPPPDEKRKATRPDYIAPPAPSGVKVVGNGEGSVKATETFTNSTDIRGLKMSNNPTQPGQPAAPAQQPAPVAQSQKASQKDAAVKDAEKFINTLFRGVMLDLEEKLEDLRTFLVGMVDAKFEALQRLIGFDGVNIDDAIEESTVAEAPQPKPKATSPMVVTLKSKVESLITDQLDDARQTLQESIEEAKLQATAAQDNVKALEDRIRMATVVTAVTTDFKFPTEEEAKQLKKNPQPGGQTPPSASG